MKTATNGHGKLIDAFESSLNGLNTPEDSHEGIMAQRSLRKNVILLVEDNRGDAVLLRHAFSLAGLQHDFLVAEDGQKAIEYLSASASTSFRPPTHVLLDLNVPRKNGLEVLAWIRANATWSHLPVIIFSGSDLEGDIARAKHLGIDAYLPKGMTATDINAAVARIAQIWKLPAMPDELAPGAGVVMTKSRIAPIKIQNPGAPTATLADVDVRAELFSRPPRPPNYVAEHRAMAVLAKAMAEDPRRMLQKLTEQALELCDADTAGISLLEKQDGKTVFRWEALSGVFEAFRNNTMPREASPCGTTIDRGTTQLMRLPDRCFPELRTEPRFVEALLVPFHGHGRVLGTVWVVTHRDDRKFDREDERIISTLGQFASAGWQLWKAYETVSTADRSQDGFVDLASKWMPQAVARP